VTTRRSGGARLGTTRGGNLPGFPPRPDRIPFDAGIDFQVRTLAILRWYRDAPEPYGAY
jgi:hypothetical protein